jgi:hypothetical protein
MVSLMENMTRIKKTSGQPVTGQDSSQALLECKSKNVVWNILIQKIINILIIYFFLFSTYLRFCERWSSFKWRREQTLFLIASYFHVEHRCRLIYDVLHSGWSLPTFRRNLPATCRTEFSTLKMQVGRSSKMSTNFYQTTWKHIQEHTNYQSHRHENLNFQIFYVT